VSIQKKNGKYVPVVYLGKDPVSKKKIFQWGHYHEKERDAKKEHLEMMNAKNDKLKTFSHKDVAFSVLADQ
jgi:hypothetical protein